MTGVTNSGNANNYTVAFAAVIYNTVGTKKKIATNIEKKRQTAPDDAKTALASKLFLSFFSSSVNNSRPFV